MKISPTDRSNRIDPPITRWGAHEDDYHMSCDFANVDNKHFCLKFRICRNNIGWANVCTEPSGPGSLCPTPPYVHNLKLNTYVDGAVIEN